MRFEHLTFPPQWKDYWTKYPHGMTILESLIDWATKTNDLIDNVNDWNTYLNDFVATFDENLKNEVTETVQSWIDSGYIEVVISAALQTQIDDVELQLNNEVQRIDAQLAQNTKKLDGVVNIKSYGAVGDMMADDTQALQNAVSDNLNKEIRVPKGWFIIKDTITLTHPIKLKGEGYGRSFIFIDPSFPNDKDVFVIQPTVVGAEPYIFEDISIVPLSGTPARDILRIINTSTYGTNTFFVNRCQFKALGGGRAINGVNVPSNLNPNGIPFLRIRDNILWGGVKIQNAGDSCIFEGNNIKGKNIGLEISMVKGVYGWSSNLSILDNNIVNDGGAIKLENVRNFFIERNNIEQRTMLIDGYAVHIEQTSTDGQELVTTKSVLSKNKIENASPASKAHGVLLKNSKNVTVEENYISPSAIIEQIEGIWTITGTGIGLNVVNCEDVKVDDNEFYISRGVVAVQITTTSKNTVIGKNTKHFFNESEGTYVKDHGIGTVGISKDLSIYLYNVENFNNGTNKLSVTKHSDGFATVSGAIKPSVTYGGDDYSSGAIIVNGLPDGFKPDGIQNFICYFVNTGGLCFPAYVRILTDGTIRLHSGISDLNHLNLNFKFKCAS